jgi:uncharacterized protein (DUF305 family)
MARLECAVCGRGYDESAMTIMIPSEEEKASMVVLGEESPQDQYAYCRGCIQTLSSPTTGLAFMRGMIQHHAKTSGISSEVAKKAADRFAAKLLDRAPKKPE